MLKRLGFLFIVIFLAGCAHYQSVQIPPRMDLSHSKSIGIIEFSSIGTAALGPYATQEFIHQIQRAQPGTRFVELGTKEQVLSSVGRHEIDLEAIRLVGNKFNVDLLATGATEVSEIKTDFRFSTELTVKAEANVRISLSAKLWETASAATVWTDAAGEECPVVQLGLSSQGKTSVGIKDPETKYGKIIAGPVHCLTPDFMPRYTRKRID